MGVNLRGARSVLPICITFATVNISGIAIILYSCVFRLWLQCICLLEWKAIKGLLVRTGGLISCRCVKGILSKPQD